MLPQKLASTYLSKMCEHGMQEAAAADCFSEVSCKTSVDVCQHTANHSTWTALDKDYAQQWLLCCLLCNRRDIWLMIAVEIGSNVHSASRYTMHCFCASTCVCAMPFAMAVCPFQTCSVHVDKPCTSSSLSHQDTIHIGLNRKCPTSI